MHLPFIILGNKGYAIFEKDKDDILVDNILAILLEDIFRQLILQRIRIKDILRIFKFLSKSLIIGNKGYAFFEKDKDNILVDNILAILLEDIFRKLILQRIRIKDILRIFKD